MKFNVVGDLRFDGYAAYPHILFNKTNYCSELKLVNNTDIMHTVKPT